MRRLLLAAALAGSGAAGIGCAAMTGIIASGKRDIYHFEPSFGVASASFRRSLDTFGQPLVGGNRAVLVSNGNVGDDHKDGRDGGDILPTMLEAIRAARVSVNLEMSIYRNDHAGRLFTDALKDAARRGVDVRVLVDAVGGTLGPMKGELHDAGVHIEVFRPIRLVTIYKIGKRTHRKILVVDGKTCFVGGAAVADEWLGAGSVPAWRDTQVRVDGPVVARMQSIFAEDWTYTTGEILAGDKFYPKIEPSGAILAQAVRSSRGDSSSVAKMFYYVAIQSAEKSILIQNAYFVPDKQIRTALVKAVQRGVDVEVMVPGRQIDLAYVRYASRLHYGELLEGGVKIFEYQPTMLHSKTMVVDGLYSTIGSINFDSRSMQKNEEESLAFYDREFSSRLEKIFREDLRNCRRIDLQAWKHRGPIDHVSELISWIWEPYY